MPIIQVALNVPVDTVFDYYADDASTADIGLRACVPFGKKLLTGIIIAVIAETQVPSAKLRSAQFIFREIKPLSQELLQLFNFCSRYYHYPLGMVIMNGLPIKLRNNQPIQLKKNLTEQRYGLTPAGALIKISDIPAKQRIARRLFKEFHDSTELSHHQIQQISPRAIHVLKDWLAQDWVASITTADKPIEANSGPPLTTEQARAVALMTATPNQFKAWLLHGVTGSGKTEVYLRIIATVLAQNKQSLVLIPEINLTPQLETVFRARFPATCLVSLHSGLNDTERLMNWLQAQNGEAKIILGTRLAVFTPLPDLGLIIVDEEHDASFKQHEGLRYSARDLAIFRAKQANIPILLGSATPSLESYHNALIHRYHTVRLTSRAIENAALPSIECIDTRADKPREGLSKALLAAIDRCLANKHQSLIFINRRGYAPVLLCRSCGWTAACHRCSSRLVVHLRDKKLCCHHCGHDEHFPRACPDCGNQDIAPFGQGTQRIEETLATHFPAARIARIDRDSTRRKNAWKDILQAIHTQQIDILVGTQILAKGHDFPNLSLVGILNADTSLYSTDFRASERLFAQLMQVAGRAGRAEVPGHVLIQTEFPAHPLYHALQRQDYDSLAQALLAERKTAKFPPFVHQALLRAESHVMQDVMNFLTQASHLIAHSDSIEMFDPVPAQIVRLKGLERAQLLVQSASRSQLQEFLGKWYIEINRLATHKIRWMLDIDPVEF
ncbi:primosomal protein N' [Nitrosomonas sp. JL21]|uniref:primosomal protein N' n=1 Tax=Nitrosomonas sp. JL21 TaxID=153949 RepID=UPI001368CEAD|nr:primosomal protein N' [Nitrosomonas sp. JL21]MBL8498816.1 primosomal protein N' [Nitrosomonas sp.]MCC7091046.1 primosomal protein N' [Nitrosomonas sp.]MXS78016.1 primosomal protein N' [Nitrosomonas sp. JL21]